MRDADERVEAIHKNCDSWQRSLDCELVSATTLTHPDGDVVVTETRDGRRLLEVHLADPDAFTSSNHWETSYPLDLVRTILDVKGPAWLCDEIRRDEDPTYVRRYLEDGLLTYLDPEQFTGKRILDFGCGSGASTVLLARMFPNSRLVGVELFGSRITVAAARARHYGIEDLALRQSPSGTELPENLGEFDCVILSAVFEHLLPRERRAIVPQLWEVVKEGGYLFVNQTPNRTFPFELHTTMLPLINYLPDRIAFHMARRFSKQVTRADSWEDMLRKGIRGGTVGEIRRLLPERSGVARMLAPEKDGLRDRIDLWYETTNRERHRAAKRGARRVMKLVKSATGVELVPDLALVFQKLPAKAG